MLEKAKWLARIAEPDLGPVNEAELEIILAAIAGEIAGSPTKTPPEPEVRAELLRWLCIGSTAKRMIDPRGLRFRHYRIVGNLDLCSVSIPFPLEMISCSCGTLDLSHATVPRITVSGTHLDALNVEAIHTGGDFVFMSGSAKKGIWLPNARIEGDLKLSGTEVMVPDGKDINSVGERIALYLKGAPNVSVAERLALDLNGAKVDGSLYMDHVGAAEGPPAWEARFRAHGEVRLRGMVIGENIECNHGFFSNSGGSAIEAERVRVGGGVFLRNAAATGVVRLILARIEGEIDADGAEFSNPGGDSLDLYGASVTGQVRFSAGFCAEGTVKLVGTSLGGNFFCEDACLIGDPRPEQQSNAISARYAFNGNRMDVKGNVYFDRTALLGGATMVGGSVGANLSWKESILLLGEVPQQGAPSTLCAERLRVAGSALFCDGFYTSGLLDLSIAHVGANLSFDGATFGMGKRTGLSAEGLRVERELEWKRVKSGTHTEVQLNHAHAGRLDDDPVSWGLNPDGSVRAEGGGPGKLLLNGFTYGDLSFSESWPSRASGKTPYWRARVHWLQRDARDGNGWFHPQPYEQLSATLRRSGFEDNARDVEVEKGKRWRSRESLSLLGKLRNLGFHWFLGYGYKPSRAVAWSAGIIILGFLVYAWGAKEHVITSAKARVGPDSTFLVQIGRPKSDSTALRVPRFNALVYSVDVFLPIVNLHQEEYWLPNSRLGCHSGAWVISPKLNCGAAVLAYHWVHILIGWAFTTLAVVGFTGLVRR